MAMAVTAAGGIKTTTDTEHRAKIRAMPKFAIAVRRRIAAMLALVLLGMQVATAAYACTLTVQQSGPSAPAQDEMADMEGCAQAHGTPGGMADAEQPGLCVQHCKMTAGNSELPAGSAQPPVATPALVALAFTFLIAVPLPTFRIAARRPTRSRARPLSVLHCCYRI